MHPWKSFEMGKLTRAITSDLRENINIHAFSFPQLMQQSNYFHIQYTEQYTCTIDSVQSDTCSAVLKQKTESREQAWGTGKCKMEENLN